MAERAGGLAAFSDALPEDDFVEEDFSEDDFSGEADAEADGGEDEGDAGGLVLERTGLQLAVEDPADGEDGDDGGGRCVHAGDSAAIRAAARGDVAEIDQPTTGPLVQRVRREVPPLTVREVEVLRLVAAGLGNQEIAERLYLSLSSVKSHLSHAFGRLGVRHRAAAVAEARRRGLLG